jgi:hypothetical protein
MSTAIDDESRLPPALLQRLIQEFVDDKKTKLSQPALSALGEYFSTFIREAIWRAAQVRKGGVEDPMESTGGKVFGSGAVFLEVCLGGWRGAGRAMADISKDRGSGEGYSTAFDGFLDSMISRLSTIQGGRRRGGLLGTQRPNTIRGYDSRNHDGLLGFGFLWRIRSSDCCYNANTFAPLDEASMCYIFRRTTLFF